MKECATVRISKDAYNKVQIFRSKMVKTEPDGTVKVPSIGEIIEKALDLLEKIQKEG